MGLGRESAVGVVGVWVGVWLLGDVWLLGYVWLLVDVVVVVVVVGDLGCGEYYSVLGSCVNGTGHIDRRRDGSWRTALLRCGVEWDCVGTVKWHRVGCLD